jgi:dihydroorotase
MTDIAGTLKPGMPADITVFRVENGAFTLSDTTNHSREFDRRIVPTITFKNGERIDCDLARCQDERNWLLQIAEDHEPAAVKRLSAEQLGFLDALAAKLATIPWDVTSVENFDYDKALTLQAAFHQVRVQQGIGMREALTAVFDCFLDSPFSIQVGLFLMRLDRTFALDRLRRVSGTRRLVA